MSTWKRYFQIGTQASRLAFHALYQNDDETYAKILRDALGKLKGPVMKVGQFLATVPGALPPVFAKELTTLQSDAPPMGPAFVKRRMRAELGVDWLSCFERFSLSPSFAASLGQVHEAYHDGQRLACKLQYPDMASVVMGDLQNLSLLLGGYERWAKALKTKEIQKEIHTYLLQELDYENEAKNIKNYAKIFEPYTFVHLPKVFQTHSTKRLLSMTWMPGKSLFAYTQHPQKNQLAENLFKSWYLPFYHYGALHGDPHPGNYLVQEDLSLSLLDFGCVRYFPQAFIDAVIQLYQGLKHNKKDQMADAYKTWGFENLTHEIIDIINQWARFLYAPLLEDRVRYIQENAEEGWKTAHKIHEELKRCGGITPPRFFVFMDRAAVGIGSAMMHLRAECNWHKLFEEMLATRPLSYFEFSAS